MTQPLDEQLRHAFDTLAERMHATVSDHVATTFDQLVATIDAERRAAVDAAAREASQATEHAVRERLAQEFAGREQAIREAAHTEGLELGRQQARSEAAAQLNAALTAARVDAAAVAARHEQESTALRAELEQVKAGSAEAEAQHADHVKELQAALEARIERASVERLLDAMRRLDAAASLSQTLDALAGAAQAEADRSAVFLVRGHTLRAWSHTGFPAAPGDGSFDVPLADAGVVAEVIRGGVTARTSDPAAGRPAFAQDTRMGTLVAVPLTMNGQVIAVVCGEQPDGTDQGAWLATHYEVLARHAARVLESLTALRLAQLGAQPAHGGSPSPPV